MTIIPGALLQYQFISKTNQTLLFKRKNSYISPRNTFLTFKQKVKHKIYFLKVFKVLISEKIYKHTPFSANKIFLQVLW